MKRRLQLSLVLSWSLALVASGAAAALTGRVAASDGRPVVGARVEARGALAITDAGGRFELAGVEPPVAVRVSHPRYLEVEVEASAGEPSLELVLEPKRAVYEEVVVSADRGGAAGPVSIAATLVEPGSEAPATVTDLLTAVPAVSENGQGGIFQTYSIRGVSRQRVLTLVSGMRIVSERRAGVSVSFFDPLLLDSVDVLRGPASTYYGSGALGGVVQLFPRRFDGTSVAAGYRGAGNESWLAAGWGDGRWSLGVARREAGDAETPGGERLRSGFEQTSLAAERSWGDGSRRYRLQLLGSAGRDIAKASTRYPERDTVYPEENHLLARLGVQSASGWRLEAWAHPNDLQTRVTEDGSVGRVDNESLDLGLNWQRELRRAAWTLRFGVDWFGRRGVTAEESTVEGDGGGASAVLRTLDGAREDEAGLYGAAERVIGRVELLLGGRLAAQRQSNRGFDGVEETAWTGFAGMVAPLGGGYELVANLGSGLRFPSLSERFFSGLTGRGGVIGNPALASERSLNADLGLRWFGDRLFVSAYVFHNRIDDYIERVEIEPDLLTYENLVSGTIEGLELEGRWRASRAWTISFDGHRLDGEDGTGAPLADVPAARLAAGAKWRRGRWGAEGRWERRFDKNDPGSGEKPIAGADLVSGALLWRWRDGLEWALTARNLLDEEYFRSADRRVPPSPARALGLGLRWHPGRDGTGAADPP